MRILLQPYTKLSSTEEELRHQYNTLVLTEEELRQTSGYLENLITYANVPIIVWDNSVYREQSQSRF